MIVFLLKVTLAFKSPLNVKVRWLDASMPHLGHRCRDGRHSSLLHSCIPLLGFEARDVLKGTDKRALTVFRSFVTPEAGSQWRI